MDFSKIKCFILDMDGTIYLGNKLFPYTLPFLDKIKNTGRDFYFFTNNSSKSTDVYIDKLNNMNIHIDKSHMLISTDVIIDYLLNNHKGKSVYAVGTPSLLDFFIRAGIELNDINPDIVVIAFDTTLTYEKLCKACKFIDNGAIYYGINQDKTCPIEDGFIPDCGSIAKLIETATGKYPRFFGKPTKDTYNYIVKKTGYKPCEIAVVGDRLATDILLCNETQMTSILVLTGEATREDTITENIIPDIIFNSIDDITKLL